VLITSLLITGKIFEDLPVLKDMSAAMDLLRTEVATTAEAAAKAKKVTLGA